MNSTKELEKISVNDEESMDEIFNRFIAELYMDIQYIKDKIETIENDLYSRIGYYD